MSSEQRGCVMSILGLDDSQDRGSLLATGPRCVIFADPVPHGHKHGYIR